MSVAGGRVAEMVDFVRRRPAAVVLALLIAIAAVAIPLTRRDGDDVVIATADTTTSTAETTTTSTTDLTFAESPAADATTTSTLRTPSSTTTTTATAVPRVSKTIPVVTSSRVVTRGPTVAWIAGREKGNAVIARTADGGGSWTWACFASAGAVELDFTDAEHGWFIAAPTTPGRAPTVGRTIDGGRTWSAKPASFTLSTLVGFDALDSARAWIVDGGGSIVRTTDGGASWQTARLPAAFSPRSVAFKDVQNGVVVGQEAGQQAAAMVTVDGGVSWARPRSPTAPPRSTACR